MVGAVVGATIAGIICLAALRTPPAMTVRDAERVQVGMTPAEVDQVLPRRFKEVDGPTPFDRWSSVDCTINVFYDQAGHVIDVAAYEKPTPSIWKRLRDRLSLGL
jgi:hypothetical protein